MTATAAREREALARDATAFEALRVPGGTALVVGTGPSLGRVPSRELAARAARTVAVNGAVLAPGWQPAHHVVCDWRCTQDHWWDEARRLWDAGTRPWLSAANYARHHYPHAAVFPRTDFYLDGPYRGLYVACTVLCSAVHLALLLGYERAALVGVDCGFVDGIKHFYRREIHADWCGALRHTADRMRLVAGWAADAGREVIVVRGSGRHIEGLRVADWSEL